MAPITSLHNPRVKEAARLRDRRHRQKQGRIVIDGARELGRAMAAGLRMEETFLCPQLCHSDESQRLLQTLRAAPPSAGQIWEVSPAVFEKLAFGDRAEGVLGIAPMPQRRLADLALPPASLVAVLEGVEKPGNIGAIFRSADAAGVDAVVLADPQTDLFNPNAIRASLGTIFSLAVAEAPGDEVLAWLMGQGMQILAARVDGSIPYTAADFRRPTAIVLGSEAEGLTPRWSANVVQAIRLPMQGVADSLNVAATAAVLFYEARRQRG